MTRLILTLSVCLALLMGWLGLEGRARAPAVSPSETPAGSTVDVLAPTTNAGPANAGPANASRVPCMSYAPYRRAGHAPWHETRPIRPEQIREDLSLLRPLTRCIRTYGVEHGLEAVPAIARELGFRVRLGVWIGADRAGNQAHLERAIALARDYSDVVDLLVVGNEVLLRGDLPVAELVRLLDQARSAQGVPVAYADVWEFWQRHADVLRTHVDIAAIHVLPYWEDHPVGIDHAVGHVQQVLRTMRRELAPLPVWLAETGWPSAGRQRGPAQPGLTEQARFVREWVRMAGAEDNLIEAFDQPWKRDFEGAMGGYWGLLDAQGRAKFDWDGPLPPGQALGPALMALMAGLVAGLVGKRFANPRGSGIGTGFGLPLAAGLAGACLAPLVLLQVQMIAVWARTPVEVLAAFAYALLCLMTALLALGQCFLGRPLRALRPCLVLLLISTAVLALALVLEGRYRPLVWPLLIAPAIALLLPRERGTKSLPAGWLRFAGMGTLVHRTLAHRPRGMRVMGLTATGLIAALVCLICSGVLIHLEGWVNTQARYCAVGWVLLALGGLRHLLNADQQAGEPTVRSRSVEDAY
ncbi:MAG: hypothetical protein ACO26U_13170 [Burkholderiaceae bacterium]